LLCVLHYVAPSAFGRQIKHIVLCVKHVNLRVFFFAVESVPAASPQTCRLRISRISGSKRRAYTRTVHPTRTVCSPIPKGSPQSAVSLFIYFCLCAFSISRILFFLDNPHAHFS
jgi:hypothetical protein